jgi:hypothetical protein
MKKNYQTSLNIGGIEVHRMKDTENKKEKICFHSYELANLKFL